MKDVSQRKILLLADYSNFHATLAKGLRELGCDVTVISDGSAFMNCERDVNLKRRPGKIGGLQFYLQLLGPLHKYLSGYDIVSLRDPACLDLRPERIQKILSRVFADNKACFLSYISTDVPFLDMLEAKDSPLKYSEWFVEGIPNRLRREDEKQWKGWHLKEMRALDDFVYANVDGIVTALYEYHLSALRRFPAEKVQYGGLPIDLDPIQFRNPGRPEKVRIFLGRDFRRKLQKGSDWLETAASNVVARHPNKAELIVLENKPRQEYLEIMQTCHVLLDQIYSYTPATMALEGMASGLTAVTGGEEEFYDFIGESELRPIINAPIELEALEKEIEKIVLHPEMLEANAIKSRRFVEKHHSKEKVARKYLDHWEKILREKEA